MEENMKTKRNILMLSCCVFISLLNVGGFFKIDSTDQLAFAAKKHLSCTICDIPTHCNLAEADDCNRIDFYEGDTDIESKCCPGTIKEIE